MQSARVIVFVTYKQTCKIANLYSAIPMQYNSNLQASVFRSEVGNRRPYEREK